MPGTINSRDLFSIDTSFQVFVRMIWSCIMLQISGQFRQWVILRSAVPNQNVDFEYHQMKKVLYIIK